MAPKRDRGAWASTPDAKRGRPGKKFNLSRPLLARLASLKDAGANLSALAEEALRAHPKVGLPPEHGELEKKKIDDALTATAVDAIIWA